VSCSGNEADSSRSWPESMLPESIPRTPPNKRAPRWRSLHIGSSPFSCAPVESSVRMTSQNIFHDQHSPMIEDDAGDKTMRLEVKKARSRRDRQASPSYPASPTEKHLDDSHTESEPESAVAEFEINKQRPFLAQHISLPNPLQTDYIVENSLSSELVYSSPQHRHSYGNPSQTSSEEDTQALYLAGAPLSVSDLSLRTVATDESAQSMPLAVRDFMDMFDDDGSYPRYFPMDLRC
jgi:hypothetical protein